VTRASGLTAFSPFIRGYYFVAPYQRSAAGYTDAKSAIVPQRRRPAFPFEASHFGRAHDGDSQRISH
jgi:hypothetical protein